MPKRSYFVFLGCPEDGRSLKRGAIVGWTSHKLVKPGDWVFFYITSPRSAVVARGVKTGETDWIDNEGDWAGHLMCELVVTKDDLGIPMRCLREVFPDWPWLRYPRQNTRIPDEFVGPFLDLMRGLI